jgi:hypothetical protein
MYIHVYAVISFFEEKKERVLCLNTIDIEELRRRSSAFNSSANAKVTNAVRKNSTVVQTAKHKRHIRGRLKRM